jgi:acyl-CoA thioester hydrolase
MEHLTKSLDQFVLRHPMRVRWSEVDMQAIVFNGHYLNYFDVAIGEYWRSCGLAYPSGFVDKYQSDFYVVKATVEYHGSAKFDDELLVCARAAKLGNSSMRFDMAIYRGDDHLISGELVYVCADPATQKSKPLPQALRDLVINYERVTPS